MGDHDSYSDKFDVFWIGSNRSNRSNRSSCSRRSRRARRKSPGSGAASGHRFLSCLIDSVENINPLILKIIAVVNGAADDADMSRQTV